MKIPKNKIISLLKRKDIKVLEEIPALGLSENRSVLCKCTKMDCENDLNKELTGPWKLKLNKIKNAGCPRCEGLQKRSWEDILAGASDLDIEVLSPKPKHWNAAHKVKVKCTVLDCGNVLARDGVSPWIVQCRQLIDKSTGCSRCNKVQAVSNARLKSELKEKQIKLIKRPSMAVKSDLSLQCLKCKEKFEQDLDTLRDGSRGCKCGKRAWHVFETFIRNKFKGVAKPIDGVKIDCWIESHSTIIETKFGVNSLKEWNEQSTRVKKQSLKLKKLSKKYRVIYLIAANKDELQYPIDVTASKVEVYYLNQFENLKIGSVSLNSRDLFTINDLIKKPWFYTGDYESLEYKNIRKAVAKAARLNNFVLPPFRDLEAVIGFSMQKITDAFGMPDSHSDRMGFLCESINREFKLKKLVTPTRKFKVAIAYGRLVEFVKTNYSGKVISDLYNPRRMFFKCKVKSHPQFPNRPERILKGRLVNGKYRKEWCKFCKDLKVATEKNTIKRAAYGS